MLADGYAVFSDRSAVNKSQNSDAESEKICSYHPHVHIIAYSIVENQEYLSPKGVNAFRSSLAKNTLPYA